MFALFCRGRVQGVFYRKAAQRKAKELGITGYTRNLSDGRVEVMACGEQEQVEMLREWLWDGPIAADVNDVAVDGYPGKNLRSLKCDKQSGAIRAATTRERSRNFKNTHKNV